MNALVAIWTSRVTQILQRSSRISGEFLVATAVDAIHPAATGHAKAGTLGVSLLLAKQLGGRCASTVQHWRYLEKHCGGKWPSGLGIHSGNPELATSVEKLFTLKRQTESQPIPSWLQEWAWKVMTRIKDPRLFLSPLKQSRILGRFMRGSTHRRRQHFLHLSSVWKCTCALQAAAFPGFLRFLSGRVPGPLTLSQSRYPQWDVHLHDGRRPPRRFACRPDPHADIHREGLLEGGA